MKVYAENERMQLNLKKCKEMIIDFRRQIVKKAARRLYFLKVLKSYGALEKDLITFYTSVIRSVLEYGAQVWHGSLTGE